MRDPLSVIILAAGMGKRMLSNLPKVLMPVHSRPMIDYVLASALGLEPKQVVLVVGHQAQQVTNHLANFSSKAVLSFALQEKQLGTGHAALCAVQNLKDFIGTVLILTGDVPLIKAETLKQFCQFHEKSKATLSLISAKLEDPANYGRIVRDKDGLVARIVEAKDCSAEELKIKEINSSIYAVDSAFLFPALKELKNQNAQGEYYLTDIVDMAVSQGQKVAAWVLEDQKQILGANNRFELCELGLIMNQEIIKNLINNGVEILDPNSVYIDASVKIDAGVKIGPNVQIKGNTSIKSGTKIEGSAYISDCEIGQNVNLKFALRMEQAKIGDGASVGPFANLRPASVLGMDVKIGNFVETKKATFAKGAKASHLSYIGDATVGADANIGAGTITCNYDGYNKFETVIGAGAFIGSNSSLIAPVKIGEGATVGAGSAISKDVPKDALAITRASQLVKENWSKRKREKAK